MRLLADKAVDLGIVESVSHETVRKTLKNELPPRLVKGGVIPPKKCAAFVWRMEEVSDLYEEPYDPLFPVVCFELERPGPLLADVLEPLPRGPGRLEGRDHEYDRRGMLCVLMAFDEPLTGRREVEVHERRRCKEFTEMVRRLAEEVYPQAKWIRLVCDNLSTHTAAAFYGTFSPEHARRLAWCVEFYYTPMHGSWLNMVEVEVSVLVKQCLVRRQLAEVETLRLEARAWTTERNRLGASVDWRFTTTDARMKLRKLYPSIELTED